MRKFEINPLEVKKNIIRFIKTEVKKRGFSKVIIGLSGGVDSTVLAYLAVGALGKNNVFGFWLPYYEKESKHDLDMVKKISRELKIKIREVKISEAVNKIISSVGCSRDKVRKGNIMTRARMIILYDYSQVFNALVLGTSNRTERLLGYGTIWGDMACGIAPLGSLYKSQIYSLADYLEIPRAIITKPPSAGLWNGQRDEKELGFTYKDVDRLLYFMVDRNYNLEQLKRRGFEVKFIRRVKEIIGKSEFKRQMPAVPEIL